jgi:hypothetical protein
MRHGTSIPTPYELPRVAVQQQTPNKHRYPRRHTVPYTQEEINTVENIILPQNEPTIHHWANAIIDPDTGASMEYRHLIKSPKHKKAWKHLFSNELG